MDHAQTLSTASEGQPRQTETRLQGGWLVLVRLAWLTIVALALLLFAINLPLYVRLLQTVCTHTASCPTWQPTLDTASALHHLGFSLSDYAAFNVTLTIISALLWIGIGLFLFWRKSNEWIVLLFALQAVIQGMTGPNGYFDSLRLSHSIGQLSATCVNILSLIMLWLVIALFPNGRFIPHWMRWLLPIYIVTYLIIINRTLVYGTLTLCVIAFYVLVVVSLGYLLQTSGNLLISLLATGLIAVLFQPLRERLQKGINHLMYGERDEPYAVMMRLSQRLALALAPDAALSTIVETVAQALKLPYTALLLKREQAFVVVASYGQPCEGPLVLPLIYQAETIGQLHLAPRTPGEAFSPADKRLLDELARHAGLAAHAVRLTSDLQHAREHLVTAREEERRRLRRDLHDGLGSALTSVMFKLDATDELLERDPARAKALLADVRSQTQASITDIRRLVYNLRPPILDEWGLLAALREHVAQYALQNVQVSLDAPESLPPLPAAVEVAVYRMVLESLANVIKHAHATACTIRLALRADALIVEIQDNGVGRPSGTRAGVGIMAMYERAAELGGTCVVEDAVPRGTRVYARFPLQRSDAG